MSIHPIVECVPNFSQGRDPEVIEAITSAMAAVPGVTVLDVDPGEATNRTVVTLVGEPEAVLEGAFVGIREASRRIDMRTHRGAHPRHGATDVCPFVPVRGVTMEDCAELARRLGQRVGDELGIPVYLYEHAASKPEWKNLATVRAGEYEALPNKLGTPEWAPDYGPNAYTEDVARTGVVTIGARPFLIAFNINLNTRHPKRAMKIAALIREKGIIRRDEKHEIVRDEHGKPIRDPGMFKCIKAIGWFIDEFDRCQVSINFTDYRVSSLHDVVDATRRVADAEGVIVTGSELVGLVPMDAMVAAGRHYLRRQRMNPGAPEADLVEIAIRGLGLRDLGPFDPDERIIERRITTDGVLVRKSIRDFTDTLASDAPAPGGGSIAALCGALSTGLSAMVGQLTTDKKGYEEVWSAQDEMAIRAQDLKEAFLADVDADTAAFDAIMAAMSLPKASPEDKRARGAAIQQATAGAIEVPLRVLERCIPTLDCVQTALVGNKNARSDAGVAALTARACAEGAYYNVCINLDGFDDAEAATAYKTRADAALTAVTERAEAMAAQVRRELAGGDDG